MIYLLLYNLKAYSLDILFVASPSGVQIMPRGVTCKYIGLFRKNMKQSSFLKPQGLNYSPDVWYVASPFFLSFFLSFLVSFILEHYTRECEFGNFDKIKKQKQHKKQNNTKTFG